MSGGKKGARTASQRQLAMTTRSMTKEEREAQEELEEGITKIAKEIGEMAKVAEQYIKERRRKRKNSKFRFRSWRGFSN